MLDLMSRANVKPLIGNHESLALGVMKRIAAGLLDAESIGKTKAGALWLLSDGAPTVRAFCAPEDEILRHILHDAVAYAAAAVRLGWYKIHHPAAFYAACLGARYDDPDSDAEWFDVPVLSKGAAAICRLYADCKAMDDGDETERERFYHLASEAARRGVTFRPADERTPAFSARNGVIFLPA